jgi:hypothetical protein
VAWVVPDAQLLSLPVVPRFAAAVALAFAPIFLANVVFAQRFRATADSTVAFGANLVGAMAGGLLEYTSLISGYRWLLALVGRGIRPGLRHRLRAAQVPRDQPICGYR